MTAEPTPDTVEEQITPTVHTPRMTHPPPPPIQPTALVTDIPRRSSWAGKGATSKYGDYEVKVNIVAAIQPMYYTRPAYYRQPPAGMYNKEHPYNLVFFGSIV